MNIIIIIGIAIVAGIMAFIKTINAKKNAIPTLTNKLEIIEILKNTETNGNDESMQPANEPDDKVYYGEIPMGLFDAHNGFSTYYKGQILNGKPHGYGTIYRCSMSGLDEVLESGRWENGKRCYDPYERREENLTDEEIRDMMHDRL